MDHEVDHQRENLISRIIMVHLVLDVSESGKAALLGLDSESLGCREVGDLVRLRMPQTEGLVPLRRVVQNSLTSFNHTNRKPVPKPIVIHCITAIKLLLLRNGRYFMARNGSW